MGILDDAIREHLELKKAHGASESEIRTKEAEAFGPVRPEAAAAAPAAAEEQTQLLQPEHAELNEPLQPAPEDPYAVHPGDELVPDPDVPTEHYEVPLDDVPAAAEAGAGTFEPTEPEPGPTVHEHHHDDTHPALVDHDHIHSEEHAPEPVFRARAAEAPAVPAPDAPLEPAPVDDPPVGDPPIDHPGTDEPPPRQSPESALDHEDAPIEGPPEDVLEETPEFLQDAPEHDRLWFEQKPPRDFDFGE